jgi:hypothetical protein
MSVTNCFGRRDKDHDRDQSIKPNHEPPHDLIAGAGELRQHEPARGVNGRVAHDHDWQAAVCAVLEPRKDH